MMRYAALLYKFFSRIVLSRNIYIKGQNSMQAVVVVHPLYIPRASFG